MSQADYTLRPFAAGDIDAVEKLATELKLSHWSAKDYSAERARTDSYMSVAVDEGDVIIGFIVGRRVPGSEKDESGFDAELYNIGVADRKQGTGVGQALLSAFIKESKRQNVTHVWLEVRAGNNRAVSFYKESGFEEFTRRRNFYTNPKEDALIMRLNLDSTAS